MVNLAVIVALILVLVIIGVGYFSYTGNIAIKQPERPVGDGIAPYDKIEPTNFINATTEPSVEPADKCSGVVCRASYELCPDGFNASCSNSCFDGTCPECKLDCSGHEKLMESPAITAIPSPTQQTIPDQTPSQTPPIQTPLQQSTIKQPKITNVKFDADGDDRKKENWNTEWVEIGGQGIDMSGWTLLDNSTHKFTFPDGFIINGLIKVRSGYGNNTQTDLYFGDGPIWNNNGDVAYLKDKDGNLVDQYSYGG